MLCLSTDSRHFPSLPPGSAVSGCVPVTQQGTQSCFSDPTCAESCPVLKTGSKATPKHELELLHAVLRVKMFLCCELGEIAASEADAQSHQQQQHLVNSPAFHAAFLPPLLGPPPLILQFRELRHPQGISAKGEGKDFCVRNTLSSDPRVGSVPASGCSELLQCPGKASLNPDPELSLSQGRGCSGGLY